MPIKNKIPCYENSLNANEEMYGTAPRVDVWFLLEYRGHWTGKAFNDSKIPKAVKSFLNKQLKAIPNSRLQLIKKHKNSDKHLKFYLALSNETKPRLYEFNLIDYEDLLFLKIKKILKSKKYLSDEKIFIVCTNGEHDTCCGKFGMPVYLDIEAGKDGPHTWETTHLGGHRFAGTFVCLPHGLYYGRIRVGEAAEKIMEDYRCGQINLRSLRGRTCYDKDVQAAEYFLRRETGNTGLSGFSFKDKTDNKEGTTIRFEDTSEKKVREVRLRRYDNTQKLIKSCGDEPSPIPKYIFLDHRVV